MLALSIRTTRTSLCDKSRGLILCQLSNTLRRMRSPKARESNAAIIVIISQLMTTRRSDAGRLETDFKTIIRANDVKHVGFPSQLLVANGFLVHSLDGFVIVRGFMVKKRKLFRPGFAAQIDCNQVA